MHIPLVSVFQVIDMVHSVCMPPCSMWLCAFGGTGMSWQGMAPCPVDAIVSQHHVPRRGPDMPPRRAAYRRHLFPQLAAGDPVPPFLYAPADAPLTSLDEALYELLFRACRQCILPWYAPLSQDREALHALVLMVRPLVHEVQARTGAVPLALMSGRERDACLARRARVAHTLCERVPLILLQHMRQFHVASDTRLGAARAYVLLGAHPGIVDGRVSDTYLRASLAPCLASLRAAAHADDPAAFSELDELLVRDLLVYALRTSFAALSPGALCIAAHRALDYVRAHPVGPLAQLVWVVRNLIAMLCAAVSQACRLGRPSAARDMPIPPGDAPPMTRLTVLALAEALQLSARPIGAWLLAMLLTLVRLFAPIIDSYVQLTDPVPWRDSSWRIYTRTSGPP